MQVPRTMTLQGLDFLSNLASKKTEGVFLEIGPLFGSSTNMIDKGRKNSDEPIYTIDTFKPLPWVKSRFGFDLSRDLFDKYTSNIKNLHVYKGYAPEIVRETWNDEIGFYFDDAVHGDPYWSNNFNFFSRFFNEETIICGDDFASGWPDIVRNVNRLADERCVNLFVIGRVWAIAYKGEQRIADAIDKMFPGLKGVDMVTSHSNIQNSNQAACWSWGLHRNTQLDWFEIIDSRKKLAGGKIVTSKNNSIVHSAEIGETKIDMNGVDQIVVNFEKKGSIQYCILEADGKTSNTKDFKSKQPFKIPPGSKVAAIRLSDK
ncbi:MAG: hypothetical protein GY742_18630 [Hyphomicrobiales bacterium]|nr:hypothetical protein [Hyphomicrobiales bacterium]